MLASYPQECCFLKKKEKNCHCKNCVWGCCDEPKASRLSTSRRAVIVAEPRHQLRENKHCIMQKAPSFSPITRCYATLAAKPDIRLEPTLTGEGGRGFHIFAIRLLKYVTCQLKHPAGCWKGVRDALIIVTTSAQTMLFPQIKKTIFFKMLEKKHMCDLQTFSIEHCEALYL